MLLRSLLFSICLALLACSTPRPPPTNAPAPAGFYRVQAGDTLYRVAQRYRVSTNELVRWNQLKNANNIEVGQLLRVRAPSGSSNSKPTTTKPPSKPSSNTPARPNTPPRPVGNIALQWPIKGTILAGYDGNRNKGIDIAGREGSQIRAAATGKVIFANNVRGYGNLLVITHNDEFLTVYAHNQQLMVKEGQQVKVGEVISSMGKTGTDRVKLHFELRTKGQAIDPMPYLPK